MPVALVVDDSKVDQRLAGRLLENRSNMTVRYATDGEEALKQIEAEPPDLVLTDMQMPRIDGLELVREVRQRYPAIPVVLMTALGSEKVAAEALRHGAASYVPKRVLSRDLALTVDRLLSMSDVKREHHAVVECYRLLEAHFELPNDPELVTPLIQYLRHELGRLEWCDETELMRISVALDEGLHNAIFHGNLEGDTVLRERDQMAFLNMIQQRRTEQPYAGRRVFITSAVRPEEVRYTIRDEGDGFEPASLPDPTDPANLERVSGRGLMLIRTFMDEVSHNEAGNEITMVKRCPSPAAEQEAAKAS